VQLFWWGLEIELVHIILRKGAFLCKLWVFGENQVRFVEFQKEMQM